MAKFVVQIIIAIVFITATGEGVRADELISREYKIKAAYLYNLIKFVNWPSPASTQPVSAQPASTRTESKNKSTIICVYGHNPFSHYLNLLTDRTAKGRPINIIYISPSGHDGQNPLPGCHIVFISKSTPQQAAVLKEISHQPLLTVGDHNNFLKDGGIIGLVVDKNNVQLQVNLTQAKKLGFEISGNLLEIAKTVK